MTSRHDESRESRRSRPAQPPPDLGTQLRQWFGLIVAVGGVAYLVQAGRTLGRIEQQVAQTTGQQQEVSAEMGRRVAVFDDIRRIAAAQSERLTRLETIHEMD